LWIELGDNLRKPEKIIGKFLNLNKNLIIA
jgi:hypothetical protein